MNDRQALTVALRNMAEQEGVRARDKLVWDVLHNVADGYDTAMANRCSERVKEDQRLNGVRNPLCGTVMTLEVMAQVGILLNEGRR